MSLSGRARRALLPAALFFVFGCAAHLPPQPPPSRAEADLHYFRGVELGLDGRHEAALRELDAAVKLNPGVAAFHRNRAMVYVELDRPEEAVEDFRTALGLDPRIKFTHHNLGTTLLELGRLPEAATVLEEGLKLPGQSPEMAAAVTKDLARVYNGLGETSLFMKDYEKAVASFNRAIELDPLSAGPYLNRAVTYREMGDSRKAFADYRAALAADPGFAEVYAHRGMGFLLDGLNAEAAGEFKEALGLNPAIAVSMARMGYSDIVAALLDNGAEREVRDLSGRTALLAAAAAGQTSTIKALLDRGARIEAADDYGATPIVLAAAAGHEKAVSFLLASGASVEASMYDGTTALMAASVKGRTAVARELISRGAPLEARDGSGATALILASKRGRRDVATLLLSAGANSNARDYSDLSAIGYAALRGRTDVVEVLAASGADVNGRGPRAETPVMWAALGGHADTVTALIKAGADDALTSDSGATALTIAVDRGFADVVEALLAGGADVNAVDVYGATALARAEAFGKKDISAILQDRGAKKEYIERSRALVFGRLVFVENGEQAVPYNKFTPNPSLSFFQVESGRLISVNPKSRLWSGAHVEEDGSFYWTLPRGTYTVPEIRNGYNVNPGAAFQLPFRGNAFYLGTIVVETTVTRTLGHGALREVTGIRVLDEYGEQRKAFAASHKGFRGRVSKRLITLDSRVPSSTEPKDRQALLDALKAAGFSLLTRGGLK